MKRQKSSWSLSQGTEIRFRALSPEITRQLWTKVLELQTSPNYGTGEVFFIGTDKYQLDFISVNTSWDSISVYFFKNGRKLVRLSDHFCNTRSINKRGCKKIGKNWWTMSGPNGAVRTGSGEFKGTAQINYYTDEMESRSLELGDRLIEAGECDLRNIKNNSWRLGWCPQNRP